ncbi:MAG: hypothetical protein Q4C54_02620 [Clostridia bacterium]|nr:hypothetical protein [Clostridia bacterium]
MKKLVSVLLAVMMLLCTVAAVAEGVPGVWYLNTISASGAAMNPGDLGMEMSFDLKEDGTGAATVMGESADCSWAEADGKVTVTIGDSVQEFTVDGDTLVMEEEGTSLIFTHEPPAAAFVPAEKVSTDDITAFNGTWTMCKMGFGGMYIDLATADPAELKDMFGEDMTMVIDNGNVTMMGNDDGAYELKDGELTKTVSVGDETMTYGIQLLADGMARCELMGIELFFVK